MGPRRSTSVVSPLPRGRVQAAAVSALVILSLLLVPSSFAAPPSFCPFGAGAGQCERPSGIAIDQSTGEAVSGDVYVGDGGNHRIDVFDSAGDFLRAFGLGVRSHAEFNATATAGSRKLTGVSVSSGALAVGQTLAAGPEFNFGNSPNLGANTTVTAVLGATEIEISTPAVFGGSVELAAAELETCTRATDCIKGFQVAAAGAVNPAAVAVDNDPSSSSYHDVYAYDTGNSRVEEFTPSGQFVLTFGRDVNRTAVEDPLSSEVERNVCTTASGDVCQAGASGSAPGALNLSSAPVAVDSSGNVWVGDEGRVEKFGDDGAFLSQVAVPGAALIRALAVDSAGNFYVIGPQVRKFSQSGELLFTLKPQGRAQALGLDPATGDLFVGECSTGGLECPEYTLLSYSSSGAEKAAFGAGEVLGNPGRNPEAAGNALAFADGAQTLYLVGENETAAQIFNLPQPGPLITRGSSEAASIHKLAASLCAKVNPEGAETTIRVQYLTAQKFRENEEAGDDGFDGAEETAPSVSIGEDFNAHQACQPVSQLVPATPYW